MKQESTAVDLEALQRAGATREEKRLLKDPFPTMSEVINNDTLDELRGWKEPQGAYVLFESRVRALSAEGAVLRNSLFTLRCEDKPEVVDKIYYYTRKGYRPIHYANFPEANDPNPARAQKVKLHMGSDQLNPWHQLKRVLNNLMNKDGQHTSLVKEKKGLEDKLAEARAEIALIKKGKAKSVENNLS